jgi:arsenate reductase
MLQTAQKNTSIFFEKAIVKYDIPKQRLELLIKLSKFIVNQLKNELVVNLNFIDEDNSKISQLLQVWSSFAIHYFKLKNIQSYSGGISVSSNNFTGTGLVFSKSVYNPTNKAPFIALIVSENPNTISPYITDTVELFHLKYPNPNSFDTNLFKMERYTALNLQIAAE